MASGNLKKLDSAESYTIAWIAALPIERAAAEAMLDEEHGKPTGFSQHQSDTNAYTWGRIGEHNIVIVSLTAGVYGLGSAAATTSSLSSSLPAIRVGLLVGIGGGIARPNENHDIRLGDVVVSQPDGVTGGVCQYDLVKAKPGDIRERKGFLAPPPRVLLNAIASIQAAHERKDSEIPRFLQEMLEGNPKMARKSKQSPGYNHQGFENDRLFHSSYTHVSGPDCRDCEIAQEVQREERHSMDPEIHYGIIASGNTLVKDAIVRDQIIADVGEDCICFEMEAAGLMNHFPCLVIRGVCDYADSHKNDRWQRYASATAAGYAKELLGYVPAAEIQESKRAFKILESVDKKISATQNTTLALKTTMDRIMLESHGQMVRKWLAAPDPNTNLNHARDLRHDGTGAWFLNSATFKKWISGTFKHLWLRGMAGCGKTVLSTTVLDYLAENNDSVILRFFFDFSDNMKQTKDGLLRSLALQLHQGGCDSAGHLDNSIRAHKDGADKPTTATLQEVVHALLAAQPKILIVLDALDESTTREEIILWLESIFHDARLRHIQVLCTSREEAEFIRSIPNLIGGQCCLSLNEEPIDTDIRSYVVARTQSDTRFTGKRLSEDLLEQIHTKVGKGANGMFRWAACQLDSLAKCLSPNEIQKALDRLPATLEETYDRMMQSIPHEYWDSAMRLLQFMVYAKRPLFLEETVEIVATKVEEESLGFDVGSRVFDYSDILRHCPSLVLVIAVNHELETVQELHLAHFSVKEYLLLRKEFWLIEASINITKTCLTYLRDIEGDRWKLAQDFPLAKYAAEVWMDFAIMAEISEEVLALIAGFLREDRILQRWCYLHEADFPWGKYKDTPRGSAFYYACIGGLTSTVGAMIDEGADVNAEQGGLHGSALQAASYYGRLGVVRLLLDKNADVNMQCGEYGTALQAASEKGYLDIVQLLLDWNADVNMQCGDHGTALQAASYRGHIDIVRLLLEEDAAVDTQGGRHGNALTAASINGHTKVIDLLLAHNADINAGQDLVGNAVEVACRGGHLDVVQLLLERGANPHTQAGLYGGALKSACVFGHFNLVQLLLHHGADIDAPGGVYGSVLQAAAWGANENIVRAMLDLGADVNVSGGKFGGALQAACARGLEEIVRILLVHGADVNAEGGEHGSPLHAACYSGNRMIAKILRDFGADGMRLIQDYGHLLDSACKEDKPDIVYMLADFGVDIAYDSNIDKYLQTACFFGSGDIIKAFVDLGVNINAQGGHRGSALQAACDNDHKDIIQLLVSLGAKLNNGTRFGSALHTAATKGNDSLVEMLIALGADVDALGSGSVESVNALLAAADEGHSNVVQIILENGAEPSPRGDDGRTPLHAAALHGHNQVAALLIAAKADINAVTYESGWTPILVASSNGHANLVELLLDNGSKVSAVDRNGRTPLLLASAGGHMEVVTLLLRKGADISMAMEDRSTALYVASREGHAGVVRLLLERGADTSIAIMDAFTPVYVASRWGPAEVLKLLLDGGANPSTTMKNGWTPLHLASCGGQIEVVNLLIERGSDISTVTEDGQTPLLVASCNGYADIVSLLLQASGIQPDHQDTVFGRTALSYASEIGHESVVEVLLNAPRIDVNMTDYIGRTALHFASREGHDGIVGSLIRCGVSIDLADHYGSTPLSFAARAGYTAIVKTLLAAGATGNCQDRFQRTPTWWAKKCGNTEIARLLSQSGVQLEEMPAKAAPLKVGTRRRINLGRYCDICTLDIPKGCSSYACSVCQCGDFDICEECFASGGHCLVVSHALRLEQGSPQSESAGSSGSDSDSNL